MRQNDATRRTATCSCSVGAFWGERDVERDRLAWKWEMQGGCSGGGQPSAADMHAVPRSAPLLPHVNGGRVTLTSSPPLRAWLAAAPSSIARHFMREITEAADAHTCGGRARAVVEGEVERDHRGRRYRPSLHCVLVWRARGTGQGGLSG